MDLTQNPSTLVRSKSLFITLGYQIKKKVLAKIHLIQDDIKTSLSGPETDKHNSKHTSNDGRKHTVFRSVKSTEGSESEDTLH